MSDLTDAAFGTLAGPLKDALDALESDVAKEYADRLAQAALDVKAAEDATLAVQTKLEVSETAKAALQAKYDTLQAAYQALVTGQTPPPPPPPPTKTLVVGAAWGGGTNVAPLEKRLGVKLAGHRTYWGTVGAEASLTGMYAAIQADITAGRIPYVTIKTPDWGMMAAGDHDAWVKGIGTKLAAFNSLIYVDLWHEPEGDGDPAVFAAMLARCNPMLRSAKVRVGACLMGFHSVPAAIGGTNTTTWYVPKCIPKGSCDFLLFDPYETYMNKDGKPTWKKWTEWCNYLRDECAKVGVTEWGFGEWAMTLAAYQADPNLFTKVHKALTDAGGSIALYFDSDGGGSTSHWRMDTNNVPDAREAAFGTAAKAHQ